MSGEGAGVSWNANQPFYEHMRTEVWDKLTESDRRINELEGIEKLNALENLFMAVRHWFDMIRFYMEVDERDGLENLFKQIDQTTEGREFSALYGGPEQNTKIRHIISKIRSELWFITAKNGMLPSKRDTSGVDVWV